MAGAAFTGAALAGAFAGAAFAGAAFAGAAFGGEALAGAAAFGFSVVANILNSGSALGLATETDLFGCLAGAGAGFLEASAFFGATLLLLAEGFSVNDFCIFGGDFDLDLSVIDFLSFCSCSTFLRDAFSSLLLSGAFVAVFAGAVLVVVGLVVVALVGLFLDFGTVTLLLGAFSAAAFLVGDGFALSAALAGT